MPHIQRFVDDRVLRPSEAVRALGLVSETDLLRLKTIARLYARGLPPDVAWDDLLQEAFTRVLTGSRRRPAGLTSVAFLAGVMRSLRTEHWRRALKTSDRRDALRSDQESEGSHEVALPDPAPGLERSLIAQQEIVVIETLFADDRVALKIIAGLSEGLSAAQIRSAASIARTDYDSTRRRMRRTLIREGLTCELK
jgi:DNA-directed RNA polymerase specialized sigma24 family protein